MQKILKTGHSLAVVIPSEFAKDLGLKPGDSVKVYPKPEKGEIRYKFFGNQQLPLMENFPPKSKKT